MSTFRHMHTCNRTIIYYCKFRFSGFTPSPCRERAEVATIRVPLSMLFSMTYTLFFHIDGLVSFCDFSFAYICSGPLFVDTVIQFLEEKINLLDS